MNESMRLYIFCVCLLMTACFDGKERRGNSDIFAEGAPLVQLKDEKLKEVSGLAASWTNPGYLWTHNDSGNPAEIYLVDEKLNIRMTCKLKGVKNRDWEDIAVGPGPDENKRYVYVADIGDNNARHALKHIYRFEEPALHGRRDTTIESFEKISFQLEDGKKDTEAIMIHPKTKSIYIVSKREKPVVVYEIKYPYAPNETLTARKVASLPLTQIVSADISADGKEILMKNYDYIYYWNMDGKTVAQGLQEKPHLLKYTEEPQGEAIAFRHDAAGFYTLSETIIGEKVYLLYYERKKH
jgi:hypothetical protein